MSETSGMRKASLLSLALLAVLILSLVMAGGASAEGGPYVEVPSYPKIGCYDVVSSGMGMFTGNTLWPLILLVPGPVVDAYMVWAGTENPGPGSPNQNTLGVNGTSVIGNKVDALGAPFLDPPWYMWRADLGPGGANLVKQGYNSFMITGWFAVPVYPRRNGVSIIAVYDTGACTRPNKIDLMDNFDWFFEGAAGQETSSVVGFDFPLAPVNRSVTLWMHHGGTDHDNLCRPEQIWAATGTGAKPTTLINYGQPSTGVNGGTLIITGAFSPNACGGTAYPPVTFLDGGYIDAEWSIIQVKINVPAGATWLAVQAESVKTGVPTAPGESGIWFMQASAPLYNPALKVTKTDGKTDANPGDDLTYTIAYDNHGYGPAENTTIVDTLPERMTFVGASNGGAYDPATRKITWNLGTVNNGVSGQLTVQVKLDPVYPAGTTTLTNNVTISTTTVGEQDTSDNAASDTTNVFAKVELAITKIAAPEPVDAGAPLTYTIGWIVDGNAFAPGVTIVDTLPQTVTFVSASDGGVFDPATRKVTWSLGTVTPLKSGTYTIKVNVKTPLYNGTKLPNSVVIADTIGDSKSASTVSTVRSAHVLAVTKTDVPDPVEAGANLTYTISWNVSGTEPARDAVIVDTLPDHVSFVSATGGGVYDPTTRKITWNLGELMTPQNGSFTVIVKVDTPLYNQTKLTNGVTFSDTTPGSTPATTTQETTVHSAHVLAVTKVDSPDPVEAGANLTYAIAWSTTGNEPAKDAMIVDTLPQHVAFVSATGGGVYDPATRKITWNLGALMTPQNGSFTVIVKVDTPLYDQTKLTNGVTFSDTTPGSTPATATQETTVHADHELSIVKSDNPDPVEKGANLTYTLDWAVTGNEPADNVVVTDPLPFGMQFVSATGGGTYDPATGIVTWNLGTQMTPKNGTLTLVVKVNKDFPNGLDISNRATIKDDKAGKEKHADALTKVVQTPEGSIGDTVWYDANRNGIQEPGEPGIGGVGLILYQAGPDGQCGTADDVAVGNAVTDAMGKYLFNGVAGGKYCVKVIDATVPAGLTLTSGANPHGPIVLAEGADYRNADFGYGPATGTGAIGDRVWSDANGNGLQDPGEVGIGNVTLNLLNAGPDGRCGTADDTVAATKTTAPDGSYLFTGVAPGKYCVKVTDTNNVLTGLTLTGGANPHGPITLAAGGTYLNADFGYHGTTTFNGQIGDLVFYDGNRSGVFEPGPGERGIEGVTLALMAAGPDGVFGTADDVMVASTTTDANGHYLFTGLPDGQYQVVVTDLLGRLPGYTQTYGVPNTDNNGQVSPYPVTITGGAAVLTADFGYADGHLLAISKANNIPAGQPVEAGANMIYTINYSVSGREPAPNVVINDMLPMQVDFVSASNGGVYNAATRTITWSLGNLNPGASGSVTLTVHVKKPLPNNSYIFNTAVISDDAKVTDEATDIVRVHAEPILTLTKTVNPTGTVKPGDTLHYSLCYANTGNGDATSVVLMDGIPTRTTYVAGSATGGGAYDAANRKLTWTLGTVGPDANACVSFDVTVDLTLPGVTEVNQGWTVDNTATLDSAELPQLTRSTSNPLNAFVKPTLTKTAEPTGESSPATASSTRSATPMRAQPI
ncbi:MAG: hypothetical protein NT169_19370 [Chloroflexi bacterium]|nr:hypothetical protein [Chloroflexota bacterium]